VYLSGRQLAQEPGSIPSSSRKKEKGKVTTKYRDGGRAKLECSGPNSMATTTPSSGPHTGAQPLMPDLLIIPKARNLDFIKISRFNIRK
jgi:hypothetical protein